MQDDTGITEEEAKRRGMVYTLDAAGRVTNAQFLHPLVIDKLLNAEVIDEMQHRRGLQFIAMRRVFLKPVGDTRTLVEYESEPGDEPITHSYPIADNDYLIVMQRIHHPRARNILRIACDDSMTAYLCLATPFGRPQVRDAFTALDLSIRCLFEMKKAAREARAREEEAKKKLASLCI